MLDDSRLLPSELFVQKSDVALIARTGEKGNDDEMELDVSRRRAW